jgi:hypothetical protein
MRTLGLVLILASGCTREPELVVPQKAEPSAAGETAPPAAKQGSVAGTAQAPAGKPPVGCNLSGHWTIKVTRKAPLARAPVSPCDDETFPGYTLEVQPYQTKPEPSSVNLFPNANGRPTLLGKTVDKSGRALSHDMGVLDLKEVAGACEARLVFFAAQGHSTFDASYEVRVEDGKIDGEGTWGWGADMPDGVEECPEGGCVCTVDVKLTGVIVAAG